jgi:VWFA-related protein
MRIHATSVAMLWMLVELTQAQSTPSPVEVASPSPSLSVQGNLVLVPALVRTKSGEVVFTLKADDFTLTDDGVEQTVSLEEDTDSQPLALIIAVETGGAGARRLDSYRDVGPLIEALVGSLKRRIAVVEFDSTPRLREDFTPDITAVYSALQSMTGGDSGAAILDGLGYSVDLLSKQPPEYRRAILLISETIDHGSRMQLEDALRAVSDTNTAIYSLAFSSSKAQMKHEAPKIFGSVNGSPPAPPGPPHGCMGKDPNAETKQNKAAQAYDCLSLLAPPLRLAKMAAMLAMNSMRRNVPESVAQLTGGEFFEFNNIRSLQRDLVTISNHVPNRYVLSFHPHSPHAGLHTIELRLKEYPDLAVIARKSYWADEPATTLAHP